jgi:hypothetical protein
MGEISYAYKILVAKPDGKRPLGRWEDVEWTLLAQDRGQ